MKSAIGIHKNLIILGIPLGLIVILIAVMNSSMLIGNNAMSLAITLDLLLTVPVIYFLLIRKTQIPNTTVIPIMIVGLLIGSYFLPAESQWYLELFKTWALPLIEIFIMGLVLFKVNRAVKTYKGIKGSSPDFFNALKNTCAEILPSRLVIPFATEVAVFYYGFIKWKQRKLNDNEFSYHTKSGTPAFFGALIFIIAIETFALHLLLERWNVIVAWVLSGLSIYTAIQMLGFAKSLAQRPITLAPNSLLLKYGLLSETEIALADIDRVELSRKPLSRVEGAIKLSPLGDFESHNVIIHLHKENELNGLYGRKNKFLLLGLHVDQPAAFKEKLDNAIQKP